jgi:hypothetical protein
MKILMIFFFRGYLYSAKVGHERGWTVCDEAGAQAHVALIDHCVQRVDFVLNDIKKVTDLKKKRK